jgi:hypothetical protein
VSARPTKFHHFSAPLSFIFLIVLGCGQAPRVPSPTTVQLPENDAISGMLGEWLIEDEDDGEISVAQRIFRDEGGTAFIEFPTGPPWRAELKNVRFEGVVLCYDIYHYYEPDRETEEELGIPAGGHPFDGVKVETTFQISEDDPNTGLSFGKMKDLPQGITSKLFRKSSEAKPD